jgi:hypothetical protein
VTQCHKGPLSGAPGETVVVRDVWSNRVWAARNEAPFGEDWAASRPHDGSLPELPDGWDELCR